MGIAGIVWGILAIFGAIVAFTPFLGIFNWINIPFALVGIIFSAVAYGRERTRGQGMTGLVLNGVAIGIGIIRLIIGGGVI
ncbi:MAG TPA: hypothetical protein ENN67_03945 [Firmicutes bacterium]|nr:hypothetical protein [Bacillota bacterium]